ncbi:uncharacterized protein [Euphorbia lathyris]|uniref:uncharacterized protein n=1 Tax=Euphorbia lathyris TaxID=212925 RepID=UPI0033135E8C
MNLRKILLPLPRPFGLVCIGKYYLWLTVLCFVAMGNGIDLAGGPDGLAGGIAALAFVGMLIVMLPICAAQTHLMWIIYNEHYKVRRCPNVLHLKNKLLNNLISFYENLGEFKYSINRSIWSLFVPYELIQDIHSTEHEDNFIGSSYVLVYVMIAVN